MKLLVVHDKPRGEVGGMNAFIAAQSALFASAGWEVAEAVCTPQATPGTLHLASTGRRVAAAAQVPVMAMVDSLQPDAVLLHSVYYAVGARVLARLAERIPVVYLLHDVTPLCPRQTRLTRAGEPCTRAQGLGCVASGCYQVGETGRLASDVYGLLIRRLQMGAAREVPRWVVPSAYLAGLLALHGVSPSRIVVVPHFIAPGPAPLAPPEPGHLLFAGRLVHEKGAHVLLQALKRLQCTGWTLTVAGEGPEREALQAMAQALGIAARVEWLGSLGPAEMAAEYVRASVVAMPSLIPESFGLVGLEAMRHARPVVGFVSGGMAEWLRDGITGRVARWGDAASLAAVIDELLARPQAARDMGQRGRKVVLQEFAPKLHLRRMRDVFGHAMAAADC